jgi:hypothetical protein
VEVIVGCFAEGSMPSIRDGDVFLFPLDGVVMSDVGALEASEAGAVDDMVVGVRLPEGEKVFMRTLWVLITRAVNNLGVIDSVRVLGAYSYVSHRLNDPDSGWDYGKEVNLYERLLIQRCYPQHR